MCSDHSTLSEKSRHLLDHNSPRGTHKVKYHCDSDWDFHLDAGEVPADLTLVLPHYRARHQPIDHRMSMCVAGQSEPMKVRVCRTFPTSKFYLEVLSVDGDITVWIPSDFKGRIHYSGKATYSAGFVNRILRNTRINEPDSRDYDRQEKSSCHPYSSYNQHPTEDEVVVVTRGRVTFRMWDVQKRGPENVHVESFKRFFGCSRKAPETGIDWDCLLKD